MAIAQFIRMLVFRVFAHHMAFWRFHGETRCGLLFSVMVKSSFVNPLTTGRPFLSTTVAHRNILKHQSRRHLDCVYREMINQISRKAPSAAEFTYISQLSR